MAVSTKVYGLFLKSLCNKEVDVDSDSLKVMLCTSSYVPDQDNHQYKASVTNEVTGTGYTAGGAALSSVTVTYTGASNLLTIDAADVSWTSSTLVARYAVIYDDTPASNKPLVAYVDFGADVSSTNGTFAITWDPTGIVTLTVA